MFLAENPKIQNGRHFMGENVKKNLLIFFFRIFQTDIKRYKEKLAPARCEVRGARCEVRVLAVSETPPIMKLIVFKIN